VRGVQGQHGRGAVAGQRQSGTDGGGRGANVLEGRVLLVPAQFALPGGEHAHRHPGPEVGLVGLRPVPGGALADRQHAQGDGEHQQQHRARPAHRAAAELPARQRRRQPAAPGRPPLGQPGHRRQQPQGQHRPGQQRERGRGDEQRVDAERARGVARDRARGLPVQLPVGDGGHRQQPDVRAGAQRRGQRPGPPAHRRRRRQRGQRHRQRATQRRARRHQPHPGPPRRRDVRVQTDPGQGSLPGQQPGQRSGQQRRAHHRRHREQQRLQCGEARHPGPGAAARPQQAGLGGALGAQQPGHQQQRVARQQGQLERRDQKGRTGDEQ
jgi:hypothetical protein